MRIYELGDIPNDMLKEAEKWRHHLIEEIASYDEHLLEKYLGDEEITVGELKAAIRKGCSGQYLCANTLWFCF